MRWAFLLGALLALPGCNDPTPTPQLSPPAIKPCEPGLYIIEGHLWACDDKGVLTPFILPPPPLELPESKNLRKNPKQQL